MSERVQRTRISSPTLEVLSWRLAAYLQVFPHSVLLTRANHSPFAPAIELSTVPPLRVRPQRSLSTFSGPFRLPNCLSLRCIFPEL